MKALATRAARSLRARARHVADRVGPRADEQRVIAEAADYWTSPTARAWAGNSHWREGIPDHFDRVGREHLALFDKLARVLDAPPASALIVEWGSGGGANAVAFAPRAAEFVAVDVARGSLDECARTVGSVCDTPVRPVLIDVADPESAVATIGPGSCDIFLCLYVIELVPSRDYAARILDIAARLLAPTGVVFVQIKYRDSENRSPHRRNYGRNLASQTIFPIDGFWQLARERGLTPEAMTLVPDTDLDKNYAYFLLTLAR
ncbi:class I SAM-dependent methyltransferase [Nocardia takedensis]